MICSQFSRKDHENAYTEEKLQIWCEAASGALANISKIDYDNIASRDNSILETNIEVKNFYLEPQALIHQV